jgi:hypothetical protein
MTRITIHLERPMTSFEFLGECALSRVKCSYESFDESIAGLCYPHILNQVFFYQQEDCVNNIMKCIFSSCIRTLHLVKLVNTKSQTVHSRYSDEDGIATEESESKFKAQRVWQIIIVFICSAGGIIITLS